MYHGICPPAGPRRTLPDREPDSEPKQAEGARARSALLRAAAANVRAQMQGGARVPRNTQEFVAFATLLDDVCASLVHA